MNVALFWSKGVPLSVAWRRFAVPAKLEVLNAIAVPSNETPQTDGAGFQEALKALQAFADWNSRVANAHEEIRKDFFSLLAGDHARAYGYALPRSPEDRPHPIPRDLWQSRTTKIRWEKDEVEGNGLNIVAVRVVLTRWEPELLARMAAGHEPKKRRPGRPGLGQPIQEAYTALAEAGRIDHQQPMAYCYPLTKEWLAEKYPSEAAKYRALSDEAIRKHITDLFAQSRDANKQ